MAQGGVTYSGVAQSSTNVGVCNKQGTKLKINAKVLGMKGMNG